MTDIPMIYSVSRRSLKVFYAKPQLTASNKPQDIATLVYIWGYPLVTLAGSYAYYTTKGDPSLGEGPVNTINFARSLSISSQTRLSEWLKE
jgi:hypothetical protein